jgi:hypothetical protein
MNARTRRRLSLSLAVIGAVLLLAGLLSLWGRTTLFDADGFTERATAALEDDPVRELLAARVSDQIIAQTSAELITIQPLVRAAVSQAMLTAPFQAIYRNGVREAHRSLLGGDDAIALRLVDFMIVASASLESLDPRLAASLPEIRTALIELRERDFAADFIAASADVRFLGWLLPLLGLLALGLSIGVAADPNRAWTRVAVGCLVVGSTVVAGLLVGQVLVMRWLADPDEAAAIGGLWAVFTRDLQVWSVGLVIIGLALSAASNAVLRQLDAQSLLQTAGRTISWLPESRWARAVRAIVIVGLAGGVLAAPLFVAKAFVWVLGLYVLYYGLIELIQVMGLGAREEVGEAKPGFLAAFGSRAVVYTAIAGLLVVGYVVAGSLLGERPEQRLFAIESEPDRCNGRALLCDRTLPEVALPTTHNSMSAADEPGWFFASHEGSIADQLTFGVRGFLIDVYFGVPVERGVRTDVFHADDREALVERYGEEFVAARDRVAESLGIADPSVEREVFLCHGFCELGATSFAETLDVFKQFLESHPREVIILFIEDHIPADAVAGVFEQVGLDRYAHTHGPGDGWPTLEEMIERDQRMLVMAENDGSGPAWYHPGFVLTQETPYSFASAEELSCRPNRGLPDSPLFQLNHWIEKLTPSVADAEELNRFDVLLRRALFCQQERAMIPNLVAVNFYSRGELLRAVDVLNGVTAPAPVD